MQWSDLSLSHVFDAAARIKPLVRHTLLAPAEPLAEEVGATAVHLKLESLQNTGAFKVRGASNRILSLTEEERAKGVITFSTGNHGKAVAYVAGRTGIPAVVCVSAHVPGYRVEKIRQLGADVIVKGDSQDEAEQEYNRILTERGMIPVVPFDDPFVVAGQGTIGLEMLIDAPDLDTILVPLSGGGLLAGIAMAAKLIKPTLRMVGVSIERSPAMLRSLEAGEPVTVQEKDTLADSLLGGIGLDNRYTFPLIRHYVDEHVIVEEEEIEQAMFYAMHHHSLVVEGGAAVGIAALQSGKIRADGERVGIVVSGASVELSQYVGIIQKFL